MPEVEPTPAAYGVDSSHQAILDNRFTCHAPKGDQPDRYQGIRDRAKRFAGYLLAATPPGREQSLAITKLEEVVMWANAAIARGE